MNRRICVVALVLLGLFHPAGAHAGDTDKLDVAVRGKKMTLTMYVPKPGVAVRGTIFMGSGDVGWVGLATTLAAFLAHRGLSLIHI